MPSTSYRLTKVPSQARSRCLAGHVCAYATSCGGGNVPSSDREMKMPRSGVFCPVGTCRAGMHLACWQLHSHLLQRHKIKCHPAHQKQIIQQQEVQQEQQLEEQQSFHRAAAANDDGTEQQQQQRISIVQYTALIIGQTTSAGARAALGSLKQQADAVLECFDLHNHDCKCCKVDLGLVAYQRGAIEVCHHCETRAIAASGEPGKRLRLWSNRRFESLERLFQQVPEFTVPGWEPTQVPSSFSADVIASFYAGNSSKHGISPAIAKRVTEPSQRSDYIQKNLGEFDRASARELFAFRDKFKTGVVDVCFSRGIIDNYSTTLTLLGNAKHSTGIHLDWSEAYNCAFAIGSSTCDSSTVLARWVLIAPWRLQAVDEWVKQLQRTGGKQRGQLRFPGGLKDRPHLTRPQQAALLGNPAVGDVVVIEQRAGDVVYIPPGWAHQVTNISPCFKVAWDALEPAHFVAYARVQQLASDFWGESMAADYMRCSTIVRKMCV